MKPLSSITFIKGNIKKVLPSFICTMISVFLVFLFGLLLYGSVDDFRKPNDNIFKKLSIVYTSDQHRQISEKISRMIKDDNNVSKVIPMAGFNNSFNYHAAVGNAGGINSIIMCSKDVKAILKNVKLKLVRGKIPNDNKHEIILPNEFMKQYNLRLGQYINNSTNPDMTLQRRYKVVGITEGDAFLPIVCDVGKAKRSYLERYGMIFFFKDAGNKKLDDKMTNLKDKNAVILEYKSMKENIDQILSSMNLLYISLSTIILIVVCISLGNLNYIVFINRKNEFSVLNAIGYSKARLRRKLFFENIIVCAAGYAAEEFVLLYL
jgi:putative ABC transport system permease protein